MSSGDGAAAQPLHAPLDKPAEIEQQRRLHRCRERERVDLVPVAVELEDSCGGDVRGVISGTVAPVSSDMR